MGERGSIASRSIVIAGVALAALLVPGTATAHPAYVDADTTVPEDPLCESPTSPCDTIAEGIAAVEPSLAVIVDDSPDSYDESVTIGGGRILVATDFVDGPEAQSTIDGGALSAVTVPTGQLATVSGFSLQSDASAVLVQGAATIANNTFDDPQQYANGDVEVLGPGPVTITSNEFTDADSVTPDTAIRIADGTASANLSRNTVSGYETAVAVEGTAGAVTLSGDLVFGNGTGLALSDDASATNVTLADNTSDIALDNADLTLDSTIVEDPIATMGTANCAISFSRGPTSGANCLNFQTLASPGFVNPGADDYHLTAGSAMIDAGNPDPPTASRDIDGDPRALDGDGVCPAERDIGADEFVVPTPLDCSPPPPPGPQPQPEPEPEPGDTAPPETVIDGGPSGKTKSSSASFTFTSTEPGSTFECKLDDGSFQPCASPQDIKVKKGKHSFEVRARDAAGNLDPTPASRDWTVKKRKKKK